jgi:hypothetical protein
LLKYGHGHEEQEEARQLVTLEVAGSIPVMLVFLKSENGRGEAAVLGGFVKPLFLIILRI